jgi:hypothetical protein
MRSTPTFPIDLDKKVTLTVPETLQMIGIGRTRFYEEVRAGRISVRKIGRRSIVLTEDARAYLRNLPTTTARRVA